MFRQRVMEELGPKQVILYARKLGLESPLPRTWRRAGRPRQHWWR